LKPFKNAIAIPRPGLYACYTVTVAGHSIFEGFNFFTRLIA
jgi:hypothetical protein